MQTNCPRKSITSFSFACLALLGICSLSPNAQADSKDPASVSIWSDLASVNPQTNKLTQKIKTRISKPVDVAGYIIANEFNSGDLTEFLLTRYPGGCIHVPLPPPSNMIHVTLAPGKTSAPLFGKRVIVHGTITQGGRIDSSYEMVADSVVEFPYGK